MAFIASIRRRLKQKHIVDWEKKPDDSEKNQFLLAALELMDMVKDATDTFKPYKSPQHLLRELAQPLRGLLKLFWALVYVVAAVAVFVLGFIIDTYEKGLTTIFSNFFSALYHSLATLARAAGMALRGITQIVTTPLAWLRALAKSAYAALCGWQFFTENAGVKRLLKEATNLVALNPAANPLDPAMDPAHSREKMKELCEELHKKTIRAVDDGQPVDVEVHEEIVELSDDLLNGTTKPEEGKFYVKEKTPGSDHFTYLTAGMAAPKIMSTADLQMIGPLDLKTIHALKNRIFAITAERKETADHFKKAKTVLMNDLNNKDLSATHAFSDAGKLHAQQYLRLFGANFKPAVTGEKLPVKTREDLGDWNADLARWRLVG